MALYMDGKLTKGQNTADAILAAAARLFERKGYHATGIDDIARSLSIARGTLYQYFSSKEDLLVRVLQWSEDHLVSAFESLAAGPQAGPEEVMQELIAAMLAHFEKYSDFFGIYFSTSPEITEDFRQGLPPFHRVIAAIEGTLRARCSGFARDLEEHELGSLAFMNIEAFRMKRIYGQPYAIDGKADFARRARYFAHGILERP